jgi:hypothetical protein
MFGRKNRQQPTEPESTYAPPPQTATQDGKELPGLAGYINQGKLAKGKLHMPPNRFTYKRPDGRPD